MNETNSGVQSAPNQRLYVASHSHATGGSSLDVMLAVYSEKVHGPLGVALCISGAVLNTLCCSVLRKRQVLVTGNCPLIGLSVSYLIVSLAMLPLNIVMYCLLPPSTAKPLRSTYALMITTMIGSQLALAIHTISLWLGVLLATQRLLCIRSKVPIRQNRFLSPSCSTLSAWLIVGFTVLLSAPSYVLYQVRPRSLPLNDTACIAGMNGTSGCTYYSVNYRDIQALRAYTNGLYVVFKVVPCVLMIALSTGLIWAMRAAVRHRRHLTARHTAKASSVDTSIDEAADDTTRKVSSFSVSTVRMQTLNRRTTVMLNFIILLMVFTQLPPAILLIVNGHMYRKLGDLFDTLSMLNNMMNFILYCKMSTPFRREFVRQFRIDSITKIREYKHNSQLRKYSEMQPPKSATFVSGRTTNTDSA